MADTFASALTRHLVVLSEEGLKLERLEILFSLIRALRKGAWARSHYVFGK